MGAPQTVPRGTGPEATSAYEEIPAMRWSSLKHLAVSAKMFRHRLENPRPETKALSLGRAIHCATLEPERWASDYVCEPDFGDLKRKDALADRALWLASLVGPGYVPRPLFYANTKEGKATRAAFDASLGDAKAINGDEDASVLLADVDVLTAADHALAERCAKGVREHDEAARLIRGGRAEEVITWTDATTGIACKARLDWIAPTYMLDLKSTRHGELHRIWADFARFLYHGQFAYYLDGAIANGLLPADSLPRMVVVQTTEPYDVIPARLGTIFLERGRELYRSLLRKLAEHEAADWWPGLAPNVLDAALPGWAAGGDEAEEDWT